MIMFWSFHYINIIFTGVWKYVVYVFTCIKLNSLQLSMLLTEGMEVTAKRDRSPRLMIPKETYISTLHTSSSFHAFSILAWTCQHRGYSSWILQQSLSFTSCQINLQWGPWAQAAPTKKLWNTGPYLSHVIPCMMGTGFTGKIAIR